MQCFISIDGIPIFIHSYKSIMGNIISNLLLWCKQVLAYMTQMSGEDRTGFLELDSGATPLIFV